MAIKFNIILVLFAIILNESQILASTYENEASVAVLDCSKKYPNVYFDLERREWVVHSADSKCFSSEKELLDLCRLVYPKHNIMNIMKSDDPVKFTIYGCTNGGDTQNSVLTLEETDKLKNCSKLKTKSVFPYKCLHGDFQSTELFIPPKCQFQHLYSNDACQSQDHWNLLSIEKCKSTNTILNTSMLLQWCDAAASGISTFSGIEFVCCPESQPVASQDNKLNQQLENQQILSYIEDEDIDDDDSLTYDEDEDDDSETVKNNDLNNDNLDDYNAINGKDLIDEKKLNNKPLTKTTGASLQLSRVESDEKENDNDALNEIDIRKFLNTFDIQEQEKSDKEAVDGTDEQKKEYEKQKQLIINSIQTSLNSLVKEKENVLINKKDKVSPKFIANLNSQFDVRFNRLKSDKERLLLQEETAYEQQVQGRLNEIKLNSARQLNQLIQEQTEINKKNFELFVRSMFNFMLAQENDRLHMITVYKKLKAYFPDELVDRAQSIKNHLESIDRTLNETINIFVKKFKKNAFAIINVLNDQLKRYDDIKREAQTIASELESLKKINAIKPETTKPTNKFIKTDLGDQDSDELNYDDDLPIEQKPKVNDYDAEVKNKNTDTNADEEDEESDEKENDSDSDEEENDNEDKTQLENKYTKAIDIKLIKTDSSIPIVIIGVSMGILLSSLLIFMIIKRKRLQSRQSIKHGFLPVETSNPEDKHLNNMQLNGYENPTYKFFENNPQV